MNNTQTNPNAVIYCRVSTKEQVDEGNSLASQERICREFANTHDLTISALFIEKGESAKTTNRKELQKMLAFCADKKNKISSVIVYKLDRISRNVYDYSHLKITLKKHNIDIKSTTELFEDNPAGRFMENIISNVAQFDNDVRAERCMGGMKDAMREGRYVWMAPLGYDNAKIEGKSNLIPNSSAGTVIRAFELVAKNTGAIDEVRRTLNAEGFKSRSGHPMSKSRFFQFLRTETYAGWINQFGERHKGTFEPIISEALFNKVQMVIKGRSKLIYQYRHENPDFPLRRFIATESGAKLTGAWSKGKSKRYAYYCNRKEGLNYRKEFLESIFMKFLDCLALSEKDIIEFKKRVKKHYLNTQSKLNERTINIEKQIKTLSEKQTLLIEKGLSGIIPDELLKQNLEIINNELCTLKYELEQRPTKRSLDILSIIDDVSEYLKNPSGVWLNSSFEGKLRLQWFNFPKGMILSKLNLRTPEICSIYNVKNGILDTVSGDVEMGGIEPPCKCVSQLNLHVYRISIV